MVDLADDSFQVMNTVASDPVDSIPSIRKARGPIDGAKEETRVLLVQDPNPMRRALADALRVKGHEVECAGKEHKTVDILRWWHPHVMLVDLSTNGGLGISFCREMQREHGVPIIVLASEGQETQVLAALEAGARDFVTRPLDLDIVSMRITAALRESDQPLDETRPEAVRAGPVVIYPQRRAVFVRGNEVHFPRLEYDLLVSLVRRPGNVRTRDELLSELWKNSSSDSRTLNTHIKRIRAKIELDPHHPRHVITMRRIGYLFEAGDDSPGAELFQTDGAESP